METNKIFAANMRIIQTGTIVYDVESATPRPAPKTKKPINENGTNVLYDFANDEGEIYLIFNTLVRYSQYVPYHDLADLHNNMKKSDAKTGPLFYLTREKATVDSNNTAYHCIVKLGDVANFLLVIKSQSFAPDQYHCVVSETKIYLPLLVNDSLELFNKIITTIKFNVAIPRSFITADSLNAFKQLITTSCKGSSANGGLLLIKDTRLHHVVANPSFRQASHTSANVVFKESKHNFEYGQLMEEYPILETWNMSTVYPTIGQSFTGLLVGTYLVTKDISLDVHVHHVFAYGNTSETNDFMTGLTELCEHISADPDCDKFALVIWHSPPTSITPITQKCTISPADKADLIMFHPHQLKNVTKSMINMFSSENNQDSAVLLVRNAVPQIIPTFQSSLKKEK